MRIYDTVEGAMVLITVVAMMLFGLGFYFLPTIIAMANHNIQVIAIFFLNLFAGWTGLGWLIALIWSVIK